jgi:hypothetical protein
MELKDLIGAFLIFGAVLVGSGIACASTRLRDLLFFMVVFGMVVSEKLDINFFSHYWYRGTTRGIEFSFVDICLLSLLASLILNPGKVRPRWYWPASLGLMVLYLLYAAFSTLLADPKVFGLFELSKMFRGILFFIAAAWFIRSERELKILLLALAMAVSFEVLLACKQRYLNGIHRATGSLDHANSLSMYLCFVTPILIAGVTSRLPGYVRYACGAAIALAMLGILLTVSRAGVPIFVLVCGAAALWCVSPRITAKKLAIVGLGMMMVGFLVFRSWDTLYSRYREASLYEEYADETSEGRGIYLRLAREILRENMFGVGLNNWSFHVSKTYGATQGMYYEDYEELMRAPERSELSSIRFAAPAHNLGALTLGELGIPGFLIFAMLWLRWFSMGVPFLLSRPRETWQRIGIGIFFGLWGIFLQSLTEWVYRQTAIFLTLNVILGALAYIHFTRKRSIAVATSVPRSDRNSKLPNPSTKALPA